MNNQQENKPSGYNSHAKIAGIYRGYFYKCEGSNILVRIYKSNKRSVRVVGVNCELDSWFNLTDFNQKFKIYNP